MKLYTITFKYQQEDSIWYETATWKLFGVIPFWSKFSMIGGTLEDHLKRRKNN